ncbi:hypothetical protein [Undibacterium luofuense]|uniref:HTH cro/C1-type domain-containing protein n=1 Tax=Undibacterium luofuense TaxID=2828733 RepID=A0A941DJW7_9BURK|nr:hypothetical protein [Undibacterium luofuense]MBR7782118.1 hypothetical protein [Undibacterium luofuense]
MTKTSIFFSWQSDRNSLTGRNLIERALERAISKISKDINLFEPDRDGGALILDRDTRNVAGSPPIVETIFRKIDSAAVFVPDLTFVGTRSDQRPTPNPNVLIEYGWALKVLGHGRVVGVMNTAYGEPSGENMPFDLRHQRNPITYFCPEGASDAVKVAARDSLAKDFENALRAVFSSKEYQETLPGEIPTRLNQLLGQINLVRHEKIRPSHVAQMLGEDHALEVEGWFLGKKTPTFTNLLGIAELFGVEAKWLQHGDGHIYPVAHEELSRNPVEAVNRLLSWDGEVDKLEELHLIRAADDAGSLYIVKKSKHHHFRIYHTLIHVSEVIGATGEADLMSLFVTLEFLYKRRSEDGYKVSIVGHEMTREDIFVLVKGNTNPGLFLNKRKSTWWEDIWDRNMNGSNYWPGYHSLRERIERGISMNAHLTQLRANIRRGM